MLRFIFIIINLFFRTEPETARPYKHFVEPEVEAVLEAKQEQREVLMEAAVALEPEQEEQKKKSKYLCVQCDVALCVVGCFEKYHTQQYY